MADRWMAACKAFAEDHAMMLHWSQSRSPLITWDQKRALRIALHAMAKGDLEALERALEVGR